MVPYPRRSPPFDEVHVGLRLPEREVRVDRERLIQYSGASMDRNRIHWDERYARAAGLPDVIAHGMLTMALAVETVNQWAGADRIRDYGVRFTAPVVVPYDQDAVVHVGGTVVAFDPTAGTAVVELTATCRGIDVLGKARVTVDLADRQHDQPAPDSAAESAPESGPDQ